MDRAVNMLTISYLGVNAWTDWRRKEIDLRYTAGFMFLVTVYNLWREIPLNWIGLFPGVCLWGLSLVKKEEIGDGDGSVVMSLGWAVGLETLWKVLAMGFLLAGTAGLLVLATERKKSAEIPFVPFLLISFLMKGWNA